MKNKYNLKPIYEPKSVMVRTYCKDCVYATPTKGLINKDLNGETLLYNCKYRKFAFLREELSCEHFKTR